MSVVVTVQEAAALHVLQRIPLRLCLFCAKLTKMVTVLVTQGRKSEVEHVCIHRSLWQDLWVGSLLLDLLEDGVGWWHHITFEYFISGTSLRWQLALEERFGSSHQLRFLLLHLLFLQGWLSDCTVLVKKVQHDLGVPGGSLYLLWCWKLLVWVWGWALLNFDSWICKSTFLWQSFLISHVLVERKFNWVFLVTSNVQIWRYIINGRVLMARGIK